MAGWVGGDGNGDGMRWGRDRTGWDGMHGTGWDGDADGGLCYFFALHFSLIIIYDDHI